MTTDKVTPAQEVRDHYEGDLRSYWRSQREAMRELRRFMSGDRYKDDHGPQNRDRRAIKIRGQETADTIRHRTAKVTEKPRSIEARPIDRVDDPDLAEAAVALLEWDIGNPWKGFEDLYEAALISAQEQRLGVVWLDWDPDCGEFGERLYSLIPADRIMWDPAYEDPHHPKCSRVIIEKRIPADEARALYKKDWLKPDKDAWGETGRANPEIPILQGSGEWLPQSGDFDDDKVTLWYEWRKNDRTTKSPEEKDYTAIEDPEQRYLSCTNGCGYRSPTEGVLRAEGKIENELPELLEGGCPKQGCGGSLERVDAKKRLDHSRKYKNGKRLIIIAPYNAAPDDEPVYDGGWPIPTARSFPGFFITASVKPGAPLGPCDPDNMWDQQLASDHLRTLAIQRVFEHRNYWELPRTGIVDHANKRFMFREDQYNVMFRDGSVSQQFNTEVRVHAGTGLDPNWPVAFGATQQALTEHRGVTDMGLQPENSKNIAAATVAQLTQIGETQTQHFKRRVCRSLGKFYGVDWDYLRATLTPDQVERLRMDGVDIAVDGLMGDDFPNYDFFLEDSPEFTGLEEAKAKAAEWALNTIRDPAALPFIDILAELQGVPRSVVRKFQKRLAEIQEQEQTAADEIDRETDEQFGPEEVPDAGRPPVPMAA